MQSRHRPADPVRPRLPALLAAGTVGYALGAAPSARVAARVSGRGRDPSREGTANPGGVNTARLLGPRWGAAVTAADVAKGWLAAFVGRRFAGETGANLAAVAAVVGHCHPPVGRGGKGVATSVGQVLGTFPAHLPVDAVVAAVGTRLPVGPQRAWTAVTVSSLVWVAVSAVAWRRRWPSGIRGVSVGPAVPVGALGTSLVIGARFRAGAGRAAEAGP